MLKITLFLHLVAAIFWIGGMLFLSLIIAPFLMTIDPNERRKVYRFVGQRYRKFAWVAIVILLITGPLNLYLMNIPFSSIISPSHGMAFLVKIILVAIVVIISLIHDFYIGPKARTDRRYSSYARFLGRINLFIALLVVLFAVLLRLGGI
jgi:copper resistance protein D